SFPVGAQLGQGEPLAVGRWLEVAVRGDQSFGLAFGPELASATSFWKSSRPRSAAGSDRSLRMSWRVLRFSLRFRKKMYGTGTVRENIRSGPRIPIRRRRDHGRPFVDRISPRPGPGALAPKRG